MSDINDRLNKKMKSIDDKIKSINNIPVGTMNFDFEKMSNPLDWNIQDWDVSKLTTMNDMFVGAKLYEL